LKSTRNKTIDFSIEEGKEFFDRCLNIDNLVDPINKTIIGDTLEVMDRLEEGSVDLIIADPPYNMQKDFNGNVFKKTDAESYKEYTNAWLEKAIKLLKPNGSIYVCCDHMSSLVIGTLLTEKLIVKNRITWEREKGRGAKRNWKNAMEDIWFAVKSEDYTFNLDAVKVRKKVLAPYKENGLPKDWEETNEGNFRNTCPSNIWTDLSVPYWSMAENTAHPTQKPEKLIAKLILASSNPGDIVFDPFLGSGTTSVVAKKLGRKYIGVEQNPLYATWAEKRLSTAETDKEIQGIKNGIFLARNEK